MVRRNRLQLYLSAAWLVVVLLGHSFARVPPVVLVGSVVLLAVLFFGRGVARRAATAVGGSVTRRSSETIHATIEPPTERHAYKPPTTIRALARSLEDASVGRVESTATSVQVALAEGGWARFELSMPELVSQKTVALEGSSFEALALACDGAARVLGPMRLQADGAELVIDGTRPVGQLRREAAEAVDLRNRRLLQRQRELEAQADGRRTIN
jgi:hypothetical protein